ncbi:BrnT family toxin [Bdellovibrio sp. HCB209]|uniref:BrnT family toxin n=1 Tax=Bdellovibrio sp. HCB209 TaxID=3394354 RepID=UPI0039B3C44A
MDFDWDLLKEQSNFRKHGIWFDEAKTIWADAYALEFYDDDHSDESEDRFIRIGTSLRSKILIVVFCEKEAKDSVRIISARKATAKERRVYEEGI